MPHIHISEELYKKLLSVSTSFRDTEESVITMLIENYKGDTTPETLKEVFSNKIHGKKKITLEQIAEVYSCVNSIIEAFEKGEREGRMALGNACDYLATDKVGMNRGSASIYLKSLVALKKGILHRNKMSFNDPAADYFLRRILEDDGKKGLRTALDSFSGYIEYREGLVGSKMVVFRSIRDKYQAKLDQ